MQKGKTLLSDWRSSLFYDACTCFMCLSVVCPLSGQKSTCVSFMSVVCCIFAEVYVFVFFFEVISHVSGTESPVYHP